MSADAVRQVGVRTGRVLRRGYSGAPLESAKLQVLRKAILTSRRSPISFMDARHVEPGSNQPGKRLSFTSFRGPS